MIRSLVSICMSSRMRSVFGITYRTRWTLPKSKLSTNTVSRWTHGKGWNNKFSFVTPSAMRFSAQFSRVFALNCVLSLIVSITLFICAPFEGRTVIHDLTHQYFFLPQSFIAFFFIPLLPFYLYYRLYSWTVTMSGIEVSFLGKLRHRIEWREIRMFRGGLLGAVIATEKAKRYYLTFCDGIQLLSALTQYLRPEQLSK
jgi:hypothetical protein